MSGGLSGMSFMARKTIFQCARSLGNLFSHFLEEQTQPREGKYLTEGHTVQLYYSYLHLIP